MPQQNRLVSVVFLAIALAGLLLSWNRGELPQRESMAIVAPSPTDIAPDLALYRDVIAAVRGGENYYAVAHEKIPAYGFPISSPLNWRLPTYAWIFAWLPGPIWIQAALVALSVAALAIAFAAQLRSGSSLGVAAISVFMLFGVVRWAIDGQAYLAQEPWAATLVLVSLGAGGMKGRGKRGRGAEGGELATETPSKWFWSVLAIATGIAALFFRELAFPYCAAACLVAGFHRRWLESAAWACGIALFALFYAWHVSQVRGQLAGSEVAAAAGLSQWLTLGGLDFVLLTTRMNSLLFAAPGWFLWLYLLAAFVGLSSRGDANNQLACVAALLYLFAFALFGRPENFYWGLLPAPLFAWGATAGVAAVFAAIDSRNVNAASEPAGATLAAAASEWR